MVDINVINSGIGEIAIATNEVAIGLELGETKVEVITDQLPEMVIGVGVQGPQGATGPKGDKGDNLTYSGLSNENKDELIGLLDNVVGETNYTNVFLNSLLG